MTLLKTFFPKREAERMEVRECVRRASAEAEDLNKTIDLVFNGHVKELSWEKFSASHSRSIPALCLPKK